MAAAHSIAGWRRIFLADGLVLIPPEGVRAGSIRVRAKVRPLVRAETMLAALTGQIPPSYTGVTVDKPLRMHTIEGEYALLFHVTARQGSQSFQRTAGMILGDDSFDTVDGVSTVPDQFADVRGAVETLVYSYSLGLGERRRRRYFYKLPPGWSGIARPRSTVWLPPDFPANKAMITVFDARPATLTPPLVQDRALWEDLSGDFKQEERPPQFPVMNRHQLGGRVVILSGQYPGAKRELIHNAALFDDRHIYFSRLESTEEQLTANRAAFATIVESIEPLPVGDSNPATLIHWAE
jgi:hypothetical protein